MRKKVSDHLLCQRWLVPNSYRDWFKNTVMSPLKRRSSFGAVTTNLISIIYLGGTKVLIIAIDIHALPLSNWDVYLFSDTGCFPSHFLTKSAASLTPYPPWPRGRCQRSYNTALREFVRRPKSSRRFKFWWWRRGRVELDYARKPDFTRFFTDRSIGSLRRYSKTT